MLRFRVGDLVRVRDPNSMPRCRTKYPKFTYKMDKFYESGKTYTIDQIVSGSYYTFCGDSRCFHWLDEWLEPVITILVDHSQQTVIQFPEE